MNDNNRIKPVRGTTTHRRDALHECLKSLTDHQRRTLHLRYQDELPVAMIVHPHRPSP